MLANLILMVHCVMALAIVILVLLQHGKGADMGAAFGSGSAGSLFGSSGAANFLSRSTAVCAAIFFATSLGLTYVHAPKADSGVAGSVMTEGGKDAAKTEAPKVDVIPAPTAAPAAAPTAAPAAPATAPATGSTPPATK